MYKTYPRAFLTCATILVGSLLAMPWIAVGFDHYFTWVRELTR